MALPEHVEYPADYPREYEADVVLRDGATAHIRPIVPADADLLRAFYDRVSDESKYYRFFAPYPRLSDRDVARFTQVDYRDRLALIVLVGGDMIAVGRYERTSHSDAEVAFLVETLTRAAGSASCCSSTSRRPPASTASPGSPQRCCRTTAR